MPPPGPSRRARIIARVADRLEAITIDAGYSTDAGRALTVGFTPTLGDDDPEVALALTVGTDGPGGLMKRKGQLTLPLIVHVLVNSTAVDAWMRVEAALADVKVAMEKTSDRTLDGLIEPEIERGATTPARRESASDALGVTVPYTVTYQEAFGDPYGVAS